MPRDTRAPVPFSNAFHVRNLAWLAAACFAAAWFLPAAPDVPGWMAFRYAFSPVWRYGTAEPASDDAIPQVLSALTNVAFPVMLVRLLTARVSRPGLYFRVAIACFLLDLYWLVRALREGHVADLRAGYYLWLAAFALLVVIGWRLVRDARRAAPP